VRTLLLAGFLLGFLISAASGAPLALSADQSDKITAGGIRVWGSGSAGNTLGNAIRPAHDATSRHPGGVNRQLKMAPAGR
jgi:hypothetical protein